MDEVKDQGGLDFIDLEAFNKTLLAKKIQTTLQYPDLLASLVLKAKYFKSSSFIWKSFMASIDIIKEGFGWSIGNDHNTRI